MQFKNPEILYLLFALIIPILIHLFQLKRFQKVAFTNVKILKEIEQQTRKSSKLKKLLILLSRLLLLASLIVAFAQPFLKNKNNLSEGATLNYLDNSFSMQAKGESGALLQHAKNELIQNLPVNLKSATLITNDQVLKNLNADDIKNEIIKIDYHPIKKDLQTVLLQVQNLKSKRSNTSDKVILISDFQKVNSDINEITPDSTSSYSFVQIQPKNFENLAIDSVWIADENKENIQIKFLLKSYELAIKNLSISLFIDDKIYGKTTATIEKNQPSEIEFRVPNTNNIQGYLTLNDQKLIFDNTLYFSIVGKEKTHVLAIEDQTGFLSKIYTDDEFNFVSTPLPALDYNLISKQQLIILNAIEQLPNSLIQSLSNYIRNEGNLVIIPAVKSDILSYNKLFSELNIGQINAKTDTKKSIALINYQHPFFKDVFQKQVTNFHYPTVQSFFETRLFSASSILQFEDKSDFVSEIKFNDNKLYWFAAPIDVQNSNFISSALIVPVFYNFSLQNTPRKQLTHTIGHKNEIIIKNDSKNDEVFHMVKNEKDFIPLQSKTSDYLKIETENDPLESGIYQISHQEKAIQSAAYNYDRAESELSAYAMDNFTKNNDNSIYFNSLKDALKKINDPYKKQNLWQLFIIFALLFLGLEILLNKFLKS